MIAVYATTPTESQLGCLSLVVKILSEEGTTQGDPLTMALYALSVWPLITSPEAASAVKQYWFADDVSGAGTATEIKRWWDMLITLGPDLGYFPNDKKCWITVKQDTRRRL